MHRVFKTNHNCTKIFTNANINNALRLCSGNSFSGYVGNSEEGGKIKQILPILNKWTKILSENSVPDPKQSAENIVAHCLGFNSVI